MIGSTEKSDSQPQRECACLVGHIAGKQRPDKNSANINYVWEVTRREAVYGKETNKYKNKSESRNSKETATGGSREIATTK